MKFAAIVKDQIQTDRFVIPYRIYDKNGPDIICLNGVFSSPWLCGRALSGDFQLTTELSFLIFRAKEKDASCPDLLQYR